MSSESGKDFNLTEWKVLSIENGKIEMVPAEPTKGTVHLGGAQGYNNGVKLLNDACSNLYSSNGVTARSSSIDDIEKYMSEDKLTEAHSYIDGTKYGEQVDEAYINNKNYPLMYSKENLSVINGKETKKDGLNISEQTIFVEGSEDGATDGKVTTAVSIKPYQTYWSKNNSYMQGAFKKAINGTNYNDLLIKKVRSYWLASRCVDAYVGGCNFNISYIGGGGIYSYYMYETNNNVHDTENSIFPIISLNASSIIGDATNGFSVKAN